MQNPILIGTGFYSDEADLSRKQAFFDDCWLFNTIRAIEPPRRIAIVDNSESGMSPRGCEVVRVSRNLGCANTPPHLCKGPLLGWSISWIIPALIAYSEGCDFVYKEQDCLAFGDWLPIIRRERMSFGRNSGMPCEQSLFYIHHDFILEAIKLFMLIPGPDVEISTEDKFGQMMKMLSGIVFHDLPGGRDRPMPDFGQPFYLQRITPDEMQQLKNANLI